VTIDDILGKVEEVAGWRGCRRSTLESSPPLSFAHKADSRDMGISLQGGETEEMQVRRRSKVGKKEMQVETAKPAWSGCDAERERLGDGRVGLDV
jgi:hypothetical protein